MAPDVPSFARRSPAAPAHRVHPVLFVLALLLASPAAHARPPAGRPADAIPGQRDDTFSGWFHSAGNLLLHVSNRGMFGRRDHDSTYPSAEWPAGSDEEYLWAAGLWVGGVVHRGGVVDTLVSAGLYPEYEFAHLESEGGCAGAWICESFEAAPSGIRLHDDDGDGSVDEEFLDGLDDDGDGRVDEDFAGISQQMFSTVYYDTSTFGNPYIIAEPEKHHPLGLKVTQESYVWTDPQFDDFVGVEFRVRNVSETLAPEGWTIESSYIGFMVDSDVGRDFDEDLSLDDQCGYAALDTTVHIEGTDDTVDLHLTMGYMFDEIDNGSNDDVTGYLGVMFLGHTVDTVSTDIETALAPPSVGIHAFRVWSRGADDPRDDNDRYRFLRGQHDTARTIDPSTERALDYRFLVSAGPFARIPPGSTLTFQVAFVCGEMVDVIDPETGLVERAPDFTNPLNAQRVYDGFVDDLTGERIHWATSTPPPPPNLVVTPGDRSVVLEWDDFPEVTPDPLTKEIDFAGYQVWKAEGWRRESNIPSSEMWRLIGDYDSTETSRIDTGHTGIGQYRFVDNRVHNGFWYWYAVSAYDRGRQRRYIVAIDSLSAPADPETTWASERLEPPRFGKYSQNMQRVMPRPTSAQTLDDVYVAPNPYRGGAAWDLAETRFEPTGRRVRFFNVPERATIRIYTLAGDHVVTLDHDATNPGPIDRQLSWNLISKNNQAVTSGIYIYHVRSETGEEHTGKLVLIL